MKQFRFFLNFLISLTFLYADAPCTENNVTKEIYTKNYPYHVVIKKQHFDNGCGIKKDTISIFQNGKEIETLSGFYDVKLRSDDEIDKNGNRKLIFTVYGGGHGTDHHFFTIIKANMTKSFQLSGYDIGIENVDKDNKKEIILPKSIFFCISDQFCSHANALNLKLILKFENDKLMIEKKLMNQRSLLIKPCNTDVKSEEKNLTFSNKVCAENNLKQLVYHFYTSDIVKLKETLKYFKFDTQIVKNKFKQIVLNELKNIEFIEQNDRQQASVVIEKY